VTFLQLIDAALSARRDFRQKRAAASRSSGEWNDDDFDVLADGVVVARNSR
jgi:hypothetical protein